MMREWPYTASNRDELGCTSPPTSRFPSALEMSLGLRPRDISRASGNLLVVRDVQLNTSLLLAVYVYNTDALNLHLIISSSSFVLQECWTKYCLGSLWWRSGRLGKKIISFKKHLFITSIRDYIQTASVEKQNPGGEKFQINRKV